MASGLPNNFISDICPDSFGFLWISTNGGGLVRYDGYGFSYPGIANNRSGIISSSCQNVVEDRFHRLWASFDEGTSVINLNTMQSVFPDAKGVDIRKILKERSVRTYCDSKGKIWLVTRSYIYHFSFDEDGSISKCSKYRYTNNTQDIRIKDIDRDGSLWANIEGGLYKLAERNGKLVRMYIPFVSKHINANFITDIIQRGGDVWIGTNVGLYRYDTKKHNIKYYTHDTSDNALSHEYISCLSVSSDNKLLVGTLCGVNIYNDLTDGFEHWNSDSPINPLNSNFVHSILCWKGFVFVGTETSGLVKLSPRQLIIRNYVHDKSFGSLSPNPVNAMYVEPSGTLWVGTVEGGLNVKRYGEDTFSHITMSNSSLSHNSVSILVADNRHQLWIGTWGGGMDMINLSIPYVVHRLSFGDKYDNLFKFIGALAYDSINDGMWIGCNNGIFFYNYKTRKIEKPFSDCGDVRGCIGSIIDKDGNLWIGCLSGVREIYLHSRKNGKGYFKQRALVYKLDCPESGIIDKITSFCQSKDGSLWLGSNCYGLYRRTVDKLGKEHFLSAEFKRIMQPHCNPN